MALGPPNASKRAEPVLVVAVCVVITGMDRVGIVVLRQFGTSKIEPLCKQQLGTGDRMLAKSTAESSFLESPPRPVCICEEAGAESTPRLKSASVFSAASLTSYPAFYYICKESLVEGVEEANAPTLLEAICWMGLANCKIAQPALNARCVNGEVGT